MKITDLLIAGSGLMVLVALAYGANLLNEKREPIFEITVLDASFTHPAGWTVYNSHPSAFSFESPDLRYLCSDGQTYTSAEVFKEWSADPSGMDGICFRPPIATGSELVVLNDGDIRLADYTLENIPSKFTDDNARNTVRNVRYITVDGIRAVSWEDSYGDSPGESRTVAILRNHQLYMISQTWRADSLNPYPQLLDELIASFKFDE